MKIAVLDGYCLNPGNLSWGSWGSLVSCVPIGNRHARRFSIAAQDAILPHKKSVVGSPHASSSTFNTPLCAASLKASAASRSGKRAAIISSVRISA